MALMFINGQSVAALSGQTLDVLSPIDGLAFDTIPRGETVDVDLAVKAANAAELFAQPDIDGGLIGGASLVEDEFMAICQAAVLGN